MPRMHPALGPTDKAGERDEDRTSGTGGLLAAWKIDAVRIGGPLQTELQESSDLIADILPPPAYVIEPYLEATLLVRSQGSDVEAAARRLHALRAAYAERQAHWRVATSIDPALKAAITGEVRSSADRFWTILDDQLLPAAGAGDAAGVAASYERLSAAYAVHRAAVDRTVALAKTRNTALVADAAGQLTQAIVTLAVIGAAVIVIAVVAGVLLVGKLVAPMVEVVEATTALAQGRQVAVPHLGRSDELGEMAQAVEQFRRAAEQRAEADAKNARDQKIVTEALASGLSALREGDLTRFVREDFPEAFDTLKLNYNEAIGALREMVQLVSESAVDINMTASEIAGAADDLARRTESNAASIEQTSAALVEVNGRTQSTTSAAAATVSRADQAIRTVASGRDMADGAVQAMGRVSESARNIDSVIDGLDRIAFQTRVLAMNAAVEAGRAGEAGRGFAVVADLVRALAVRAEAEAEQAKAQLSTTQQEIEGAVAAVQQVDGALAAIVTDVEEVHVLLATMSSNNSEQASAVAEITAAVDSMDRATQQNAAMVEQTSAATRALSGEVRALADRAATFKFERRQRSLPVAVDRRVARKPAAAAPPLRPPHASVPVLKVVESRAAAADSDWSHF